MMVHIHIYQLEVFIVMGTYYSYNYDLLIPPCMCIAWKGKKIINLGRKGIEI